jgi:alanine-alpha-ketoisovalerate/valine-pyruvate aminotransferase
MEDGRRGVDQSSSVVHRPSSAMVRWLDLTLLPVSEEDV